MRILDYNLVNLKLIKKFIQKDSKLNAFDNRQS